MTATIVLLQRQATTAAHVTSSLNAAETQHNIYWLLCLATSVVTVTAQVAENFGTWIHGRTVAAAAVYSPAAPCGAQGFGKGCELG